MSEIKDGLETVEQAIYESVALVLPGATALTVVTCVLAPDAAMSMFALAVKHAWITVAMSYVAGYLVQSTSRPVTNFTRAVVAIPRRVVRRMIPTGVATKMTTEFGRAMEWLTRGHKPVEDPRRDEHVRLTELARARWERRLGLADGQQLRLCDALDLSFSVLGAEQRRLHRFRAFTSLCRAMAAICAVAEWTMLILIVGPWPATVTGLATLFGLILGYAAFTERANMYDRLWNGIIPAQFLADATADAKSNRDSELPTPPGRAADIPASTPSHVVTDPAGHTDSIIPMLPRDEAPSPIAAADALGTAPKTQNGDLLS